MATENNRRWIVTISVLTALSAVALCFFGCMTGWDFDPSDSDALLIVTGSMDAEPRTEFDVTHIPRNSLVVIEHLNRNEVAAVSAGDVLAYRWDGSTVVHRVVSVDADFETIVLKGDANSSSETISFDDVRGRVISVYPVLGAIICFSKETPVLVLIAASIAVIAVSAAAEMYRIIKDKEE